MYEGSRSPYFWQIVLVGGINSALGVGGAFLALAISTSIPVIALLVVLVGIFTAGHVGLYSILADKAEDGFPQNFAKHLPPPQNFECEFNHAWTH